MPKKNSDDHPIEKRTLYAGVKTVTFKEGTKVCFSPQKLSKSSKSLGTFSLSNASMQQRKNAFGRLQKDGTRETDGVSSG